MPLTNSSVTKRWWLAAAVASTLVLASCSSGGGGDTRQLGEGCVDSGEASESVSVSTSFGDAPDAEFDAPLTVESTERTLVIEGDGEAVELGDVATVSFTLYNGSSGEELQSTGHGEGADRVALALDEAANPPGLVQALNCSVVGDRIVAVIPAADGFGEMGYPELGIAGDDSIVFVMDLVEPYDASADMVEGEPDDPRLPSVTYDDAGTPTVTFPETAPPGEPTLQIIAEGTGDVVEEGDMVEVNYHGVNWNTGVVFDSSWERGEPVVFGTDQVIPGFGAALVGQPVGTQLVVSVPPTYGYGSAGRGENIGGTDTIVFAVDILGIQG